MVEAEDGGSGLYTGNYGHGTDGNGPFKGFTYTRRQPSLFGYYGTAGNNGIIIVTRAK